MKKHIQLFNRIAPVYGLFYKRQYKKYSDFIEIFKQWVPQSKHPKGLDVGFGTGALLSALTDSGYQMDGIEGAEKMVQIAKKKPALSTVKLLHQDVLKGLPYADNSFDFVIASYMVHGLETDERIRLLKAMKRVAKHYVILYEHSKSASRFIQWIERLEGGQYFNFKDNILSELTMIFPAHRCIAYQKQTEVYVCAVNE